MNGKRTIKLLIMLGAFALISFSDWTFAAENNMELMKEVGLTLNLIVNMMAWVWVFLAKGAGELLSNNWVYGEILGWDAILWKYRNLMKNFANFGLGFYFLYEVLKGLFNSAEKIKEKLVWLLVAGVGIQASWFFTAVVVDLSTITLATVGSFPAVMVSDKENFAESMATSLNTFLADGNAKTSIDNINQRINFGLFSSDMGASSFIRLKAEKLEKSITKEQILDELLPNSDSLSGPLYYLGFSILKTTSVIAPNTSNEKGWMNVIFNTLLQGGTTVIYCIEMLVLFIFAFMRVLYMWIFIILSPMVVLLWCINQSGGKGGEKGLLKGFTKHVNFSSFFWNAFKPTLIALGISLSMIFVSLMSSVISANKFEGMKGLDVYQYQEKSDDTSNPGNKKYITVMDGETMEISMRNVGKTVADFVLSIVTLILVYLVIKVAVNMGSGEDFVSKSIKSVQSNVESGIGSMPLIPVAGWDKNGQPETHYISAGKTFGFGSSTNKGLIGEGISVLGDKLQEKVQYQTDSVNKLLGLSSSAMMSETAWGTIKSAGKNMEGLNMLRAKKLEIDKQKTENGWGLMLDPTKGDKRWINDFETWLESVDVSTISSIDGMASSSDVDIWKKMAERRRDKNNKGKSLGDMFMDKDLGAKAIKAYSKFFGLGDDITTWEALKQKDISKK